MTLLSTHAVSHRPIDTELFAADAEALAMLAKLVKGKGQRPTLGVLSAALRDYPNDADVIRRMLKAANNPKAASSLSPIEARLRTANVPSAAAQRSEHLRAELDKRIIGQAGPKAALVRACRAAGATRGKAPVTTIVLTGPSGVGKSEMAKALTKSLHGDDVQPVVLEGAMFKSQADLAVLEGSAPGFVGYGDSTAPLSQDNIDKCFHGKKPIVILLDEVDDIDPSCRTDFWGKLNKIIDEGYFKLKNGETIDLTGAYIVVTSNAGLDAAKDITGEARTAHLRDAFIAMLPQKIKNRIGQANIIAMENLSRDNLAEIVADRFVKPYIDETVQALRSERGFDVAIRLDDDALALLVDLALNDETGARTARRIVDNLLKPAINEACDAVQDEDIVTIAVRHDLDTAGRNQMIAKFQQAGDLPPDIDVERSPFTTKVKSVQKAFAPYDGAPPFAGVAPIIHSSGLLGGRGFLLFNAGLSESMNTLALLKPGAVPSKDEWAQVKLPEKLAACNFSLDAVPLDATRLLITGVHVDPAANTAANVAAIYDINAKKFSSIEAPPLVLVGATLAAVNDKVLLWGGRVLECSAAGDWSVHLPADGDAPGEHHDNGVPVENTAWCLDLKTQTWTALQAAPARGRVGAAAVTYGGKVYLVGGEEVCVHESGPTYSQAARRVLVFDPQTDCYSEGPELAQGVAYAKAFVSGDPPLVFVVGGAEFLERDGDPGAQLSATATLQRVRLDGSTQAKTQDLPGAVAQVALVPRLSGHVVGPMTESDPEWVVMR